MEGFKLNGRQIKFSEVDSLLEGKGYTSEFEKNSMEIIKDWRQGKDQFVLTTSGSTGQPKNITLTRQQMQSSAEVTCNTLGLIEGDKSLVCINSGYIGGKMMVVRSLLINMEMIMVEPSLDPLKALDEEDWFDFVAMVPLQLDQIVEEEAYKEKLNHCKAIIIGGAPVSLPLLKKIQQVKAPVYATYGMTETVSHIALKRLNGMYPDANFKVLPGVTIGIDDRNCLTIQSPQTNQQKIVTNDLVKLVNENEFEWLGRVDNIINTGGIKVQLEVLERMLYDILADFGIENQFFVTGIDDDQLGQRLVLLLEGTAIDHQHIFDHMKANLGRLAPKAMVWVEKFEMTATGKIQRKPTIEKYAVLINGSH